MRENLQPALRWVLAHEGGFVNHPKDPGGPTNRGVTQRVYDGYRDRIGQPRRSVRAITNDEVGEIYLRQYWKPIRGDDLPAGLDYAVFDFAVNSGVKRAAQELQRVLGVKVDGTIGEVTLAAARKADVFDLIERLCARRMEFLRGLRTWPTFGKGWSRRVMGQHDGAQDDDAGVIDRAIGLAAGDADRISPPVAAAQGKAEAPERTSPVESSTVQASAVQIASGAGAGIAAVGALDGWAQIAVIGFAGLVILLAIWILRERLRAWAEGVR